MPDDDFRTGDLVEVPGGQRGTFLWYSGPEKLTALVGFGMNHDGVYVADTLKLINRIH